MENLLVIADPWTLPLIAFGLTLIVQACANPNRSLARKGAVFLFELLTIRYLVWRFTCTLPDRSDPFAVPAYILLGIEVFLHCMALRVRHRSGIASDWRPEATKNLRWYGDSPPPVAVFIPTYNENREILEQTIIAACGIRYENFHIWVLDDGRRPWLSALCRDYGVRYLSRETNEHFKAGNLNHGLKHALSAPEKPEFIAVLDADFIALPEFLERTLALMKAPRTGIVQTPQRFYNPDPFQYAFGIQSEWPDDQRGWFDYYLPMVDRKGGATCCGTSCLIRVEALEKVGGFPIESICEDTLLSIKLNTHGWRTIYLNEGLSFGLSPEGLAEFLNQRARWELGNFQISAWQYRNLGRISLRWRLEVILDLLHAFLRPTLALLWLALPVLYWTTGFVLIQASFDEIVSYVFPLWANRMLLSWISQGALMPLVYDGALLITFPLLLQAVLRGLFGSRNIRFDVTRKGINRSRTVVHWRPLFVLGSIAISLVGSLWYGLLHPDLMLAGGRYFLWTLYATFYNLIIIFIAIAPCVEKPKFRRSERFPGRCSIPVIDSQEELPAKLIDISARGAQLELSRAVRVGDALSLRLFSDKQPINARVVRLSEGRRVGIEFETSRQERIDIVRWVYCSRRFVPEVDRWNFWPCMRAVARKALL